MLSVEASEVTTLLLARHALLCRCVELEDELENLQTHERLAAELPTHHRMDIEGVYAEVQNAALSEFLSIRRELAGLQQRTRLAWRALNETSGPRKR